MEILYNESMEIKTVSILNPDHFNLILGQSHFIKTVEDLYESLIQSSTGIQFGISFCEASGPRLIRSEGNREDLIELAKKNAMNISCGHSFIIFMDNAFPINVLKSIQSVPEVCNIFCATSNSIDVIIMENDLGKGILGVIDGEPPLGFESTRDIEQRHLLLRKFGYKL